MLSLPQCPNIHHWIFGLWVLSMSAFACRRAFGVCTEASSSFVSVHRACSCIYESASATSFHKDGERLGWSLAAASQEVLLCNRLPSSLLRACAGSVTLLYTPDHSNCFLVVSWLFLRCFTVALLGGNHAQWPRMAVRQLYYLFCLSH
jgi:hypothetical protein